MKNGPLSGVGDGHRFSGQTELALTQFDWLNGGRKKAVGKAKGGRQKAGLRSSLTIDPWSDFVIVLQANWPILSALRISKQRDDFGALLRVAS
jgi:hypothetical protein